MSITFVPTPAVLVVAILFTLLVVITACFPDASQRILRLLEALRHLIHGTCPDCGQKCASSRRCGPHVQRGSK